MPEFDKKLHSAEIRLRKLLTMIDDPKMKKEASQILEDVLSGHYEAQEAFKDSWRIAGKKYPFLFNGLTDYLEDDFD